MKCEKVHWYLALYLDSDLSPETSYEIARHLETCEPCRSHVEGERRLEGFIGKTLSAVGPGERQAWDRAARKAFPEKDRWSKRWLTAAALLLTASLSTLLWHGASREVDFAQAMSESHGKYLAGGLAPTVDSGSPEKLSAYFSDKFAFSTRIGTPSGSSTLLGGRCCYLGRSPCAFLMAHVDNAAVSIFLMDKSQLASFPEAKERMEGGFRCRAGPFHVFAFRDGDRVVGIIGELPTERLEAVALEVSGALVKEQ